MELLLINPLVWKILLVLVVIAFCRLIHIDKEAIHLDLSLHYSWLDFSPTERVLLKGKITKARTKIILIEIILVILVVFACISYYFSNK